MMTPAWILDILAALMLVVAAVSAARLVTARPWASGEDTAGPTCLDVDVAHLLMAIAMAGMLTASLHHSAEHRLGRHLRADDSLVRLDGCDATPGRTASAPG